MKRIALILLAVVLAFAPFGATKASADDFSSIAQPAANGRVAFSPISYELTPNVNVAKARFYATFACYEDFKTHTFVYKGKVVVYMTARSIPEGMMCIQALNDIFVNVDMSRVNVKTSLLDYNLKPVRYAAFVDPNAGK